MFETLSLTSKNQSIWPIMAYKNYPFINANTRFFQRSLFIQVVSLEVLEKDIKGLKKRNN